MNFRQTTWGVGLLGALALLGCGGDDTPTPTGWEEGGIAGAGGAGNDASAGTGGSTVKADGSAADSGGVCRNTAALMITLAEINACRATLPETGADSGGDAGAGCFSCLCAKCPTEATPCNGDPYCKGINDCCRAACSCPPAPAAEGGSDAHAGEGGGNDEASTTDSPAGDGAAE